MESLDELSKATNGKPGFFKHVFNFDDDSKSELMNIIQYAILALIPVIILNKSMQRFVPEADEEKNSFEILAEIVGQILVMFLGMLLIHRIITFIPTYSGEKYADFSITSIILGVLVIILSLQTKLGEKVSIVVDRLMELWNGNQTQKGAKGKKRGSGNVRVSQPISQHQQQQQGQGAMNQSLNSMGTTSISSLPITQPMPDYNSMHQEDATPLVGAATPGMGMAMESFAPMAANDALGGGAFSAW
jgi:hypothetical protein